MDVAGWEFGYVATMTLTGEEVLSFMKAPQKDKRGAVRFIPQPDPKSIDPRGVYRVAMPPYAIIDYAKRTQTNPDSFRLEEVSMRQVLKDYSRTTD